MSKKTVRGYNLSPENHKWLKKSAEKDDRSASSVLDKIVTSAREKEKESSDRR